MPTVTGLTAARMAEIEAASVVDGEVVGDNLILTKYDTSTINAGNVRGPIGPDTEAALETVWVKAELPPYVLPRGEAGNAETQTQEILDALTTSSEVWLPPGVHPVTSIIGSSAKRLRGSGDRTIVKQISGTDAVIKGENLDRFEVCDLVIDGNKAAQAESAFRSGLVFSVCTNSAIRRCIILNAVRYGVQFFQGYDLSMDDCELLDIGKTTSIDGTHGGFHAQGGIENLSIVRNKILRASDSSIIVAQSDGVRVIENLIDGSEFIGIGLASGGTTNATVANNVVRNTEGNGIDTGDATNVSITGNVMDTCNDGIDSDMSALGQKVRANLSICGNVMRNCAANGIIVIGPVGNADWGAEGVTINGNTIDVAQLNGIAIDGIHNSTINGNAVRNASRLAGGFGGITLQNTGLAKCLKNIVTSNRVFESGTPQGYGILKVAGNDYTLIANNILRDCSAALALVAETNDVIVNNIV